MHLVIIMPAFNEAGVIGSVIKSLPKEIAGIDKITSVVIDDNSSDETKTVAKFAGAKCIRHEVNLGVGGATITGFEAAKKMGADIVVTIDADGQHDPKDITNLVKPIIDDKADVALGSRFLGDYQKMPRLKVFGNKLMNLITYAFFRIWVSDSQSGYKAFSRTALEKIDLLTSGYELCSEIIGEIKRQGLRYKEVPISTIYTDYSKTKGQLALNAINIILGLSLRKLKARNAIDIN